VAGDGLDIRDSMGTGGIVKILGNDCKKSKLHSRRNEERLEVGECLLPFGKNNLSPDSYSKT
jgi:hypothetical protein